MVPSIQRATIEDLHDVDGKAELIGGSIVPMMATGHLPGKIAYRIARLISNHTDQHCKGEVHTDNVGFAVPELSSGRESFAPDVSYYDGPMPANPMDFIKGPATFAVEVRSKGDYGPAAEFDMSCKRADYFEAGTKVVWDVDPIAECIHIFRIDAPGVRQTVRRGELAIAEPALPGWSVPVDVIFAK